MFGVSIILKSDMWHRSLELTIEAEVYRLLAEFIYGESDQFERNRSRCAEN